ncbi:GGDEF domain-containing protein [Bacillus sp. T33-2]|nr:GGDEF domain-containing protein [Bacillus sp. T33-2]
MWAAYVFYPPSVSGDKLDVFAFLFLMSIVASMPMVINKTSVFLIQWVSLAVFLTFGLFVEMVLAQVAIAVLMVRLRLQKNDWFRLPLNSLMFFMVSLLSGIIFYALGGVHGTSLMEHQSSMLLAALYEFVSFALNHVMLTMVIILVYKEKGPFFGEDFVWEAVVTILTFPVGFVLYILYFEVGILSVLFIGVPFASLSIILNLYYSSEKINIYLQKAAEIGHQLAERLEVNQVMDLFAQKLMDMLPVDYAYLLEVVDANELELIIQMEEGQVTRVDEGSIANKDGVSGLVWATKKPVLFHSKKDWANINAGDIPEKVESILGVPIMRSNQVVGVLVLASNRTRAFEKSQLMIVDVLCSHFAIAVENAKHYEKTKEYSERCALTGLYNYRYFENLLSSEFEKLQNQERNRLSLILLDIDHFKMVNDTYGHQSGNEILSELANRLAGIIGCTGTVARYGGEEFVVLLPEMEKAEAFKLAEQIRLMIANRPFLLNHNLELDRKELLVGITASIGVATAPHDAEDSLALIRHADRALYVGAKRSGRNRVAEYVK